MTTVVAVSVAIVAVACPSAFLFGYRLGLRRGIHLGKQRRRQFGFGRWDNYESQRSSLDRDEITEQIKEAIFTYEFTTPLRKDCP